MRWLASSLAAGATALALPVALGLVVFLQVPGVDANGLPDNDSYRAAGILLVLSPAILICVSAYFLMVAGMLRLVDKLAFGTLVAVSGACAAAFGALFAVQGFRVGGPSDALIAFGLFGGSSFASLALGSLALIRTWPTGGAASQARDPGTSLGSRSDGR